MQIQAIDLREGYIVLMDGKYCTVLEVNPIERGRGKSYVQVIYKTIDTGNKNNARLATDEMIEKMNSVEKEGVLLYTEKDRAEIMLLDTNEQVSLDISLLNGDKNFLSEGMKLLLTYIEENEEYIAINFEHHATFDVQRRDNNCAVIANEVQIKVPDFIKPGDRIIVNITRKEYLSKE